MPHLHDPGYTGSFGPLCEDYPDTTIYPQADFRTEWGPVFHRGRLDGSARVLVIGQDPAQHEIIARRILVGEAGHRIQGFLAKLGIDHSYVMVNTFLYSVYGQGGGSKHRNDPGIIQYRNRWLDALIVGKKIDAVVALGGLADEAWTHWKATPTGAAANLKFAKITHPTQPESSSKGDKIKHAEAVKALLQNWNLGLQSLKPSVTHPDAQRALVLYGETFQPGDLVDIPEADLPAGSPPWMCGAANWAKRTGDTPVAKRVNITVTVPKAFRP